jgi:hypothetical protein
MVRGYVMLNLRPFWHKVGAFNSSVGNEEITEAMTSDELDESNLVRCLLICMVCGV